MYENFYNSEEDFLAIYTTEKLESGGEPIVTREELLKVIEEFSKSWFYHNNFSPILNFIFEDMERLAKKFQEKADKNRRIGPCFVANNDFLLPTYSFYNYTYENNSRLSAFLIGKFQKDFKDTKILYSTEHNNETTKKMARLGAKYLTEYFAKKYIDSEVAEGRWPRHLTDLSFIFEKDLGKILQLKGTKEFFADFYNHLYFAIVTLTDKYDGHLILTDQKAGDLAFNNLKRMLSGYPTFEHMITSGYLDKGSNKPKKFTLEIKGGIVKVNENVLIDHDPYGEWSDTYKKTEIILRENNNFEDDENEAE